MPEPPGFLNELSFIVHFIFNKCHHPWTLYAKWSIPPTENAARSILMLDVPQVLRSALRPHGARTKRHGGKQEGKRGKGKKGILDPYEMLGDGIKNALDLEHRVSAHGTEQLWTILGHAETALNVFFLVDLVETWLYQEALLVSANDPSDCGLNAVRMEGGGGVVTDGFDKHFLTGGNLIWATGTATAAAGVLYVNCERGMATCSLSVRNDGDGTGRKAPMTIHLGPIGEDGNFMHGFVSTVDVDYGQTADLISTVFFSKGDASSFAWALLAENTGGGSHAAVLNVVYFGQQY